MTAVDAALASLPIRWHPPSPLTRDRCEKCGLLLFEDERVEHTGTFTVRDDDPLLGGIGGITATYCTEHAPKEATR